MNEQSPIFRFGKNDKVLKFYMWLNYFKKYSNLYFLISKINFILLIHKLSFNKDHKNNIDFGKVHNINKHEYPRSMRITLDLDLIPTSFSLREH